METFDIVPESPVDKPYVETNYNGTLLLAESDYRIGSNPVNSIKCTTVVKKVVNEYTNIRVILPGNIAVTAEKIGINLVDIENKKVATIVAPIKANHLAIKTEDIIWSTIVIPESQQKEWGKIFDDMLSKGRDRQRPIGIPSDGGNHIVYPPVWTDGGISNAPRLNGGPYYRAADNVTLGHVDRPAVSGSYTISTANNILTNNTMGVSSVDVVGNDTTFAIWNGEILQDLAGEEDV